MTHPGNNAARRISICTLGCKVNQYESAQLHTLLASGGYTVAMGDRQGADLYIVNTCTVTGSTDAQSRQLVNRLLRLNPGAPVLVTGCYAQVAPHVFRAMKGVCGVVGRADKGNILNQVNHLFGAPPAQDGATPEWPVPSFPHRTRAFIKVQDGCNGGCSYCIIPRARGASRSRPSGEILREAQALACQGHREVVITGVNLGLYGRDLDPPRCLSDLMRSLGDQGGIPRLRISSLEPMELTPSLVEWLASCPSACPHLHVSLQSGDNGVLQRMNRRYTAEDFQEGVRKVIHSVSDTAIGVDVLVGFPGEDEAAFRCTFRLLEELPVAYFHVFPFSPRPGTPAARFRPQVRPEEIQGRCAALRLLGKKKRELFARRFVGRSVPVLVESARDPATGMLRGFTPHYLMVRFPGPNGWMNRQINVTIHTVSAAAAIGVPDGDPGRELEHG